MDLQWLAWARRLQALAQSGLAYTENPFDRERYEAVRQVAAELVAGCARADPGLVAELFDGEAGYATPKVDVRGVVFRDDTILLVKERADGRWTLPGGWADVDESPAEATEREVCEESGYRTRAIKLLALYDRNRHGHTPYVFHIYKVFFRCELLSGEPSQSIETAEVGFFREDSLPELSLGRVTPGEIARFFEHLRHPDWPTDFD
ncbi:MAG: NUDIX hydrolase [Anaerolineae bacterium]|nr:NUDIX hydrolase [Anaerolineae bacterium]